MKVKELMSTKLITIDVNDTVRNALKLLKKHRITRLLVTRKKKIEGIVTERDLLKAITKGLREAVSDAHLHVSSCYTKRLLTISSEADCSQAAKLMLEHGISSLVVKDGKIEGIITKSDLIKALKDTVEPVKAVMHAPVTYLRPESSLLEARRLMLGKGVKHIPVLEGSKLVGIIAESDIAKAIGLFRKVAKGRHWDAKLKQFKVSDVMKTQVITAKADTPIGKIAKLMLENRISSVPIVEGEKLIGIVTKTDLIRYLAFNTHLH